MLDLASKKRTLDSLDVPSSYCMSTSNKITRAFTPLPENIFEEPTSSTTLLPVVEPVPPEDITEEMTSLNMLISVTEPLPELSLLAESTFEEPASLTTLLPLAESVLDFGGFKKIEVSCTISNNNIFLVNNKPNTVPDTDEMEIIEETESEEGGQNVTEKLEYEENYYDEGSDDKEHKGSPGERKIKKDGDKAIENNENRENDKVVESSDSEDNLPLAEIVKRNAPKGYKKNGERRKRKKKRKSEEIRLEKSKKLKLLVEKHKVVPPCSVNACRKKCISIISENQRQQINLSFWNLTEQERRNYILASCSRLNVQKRRETDVNYRKNNTFKYFLKDEEGKSKEVCKIFYLTTLGFHKNNDRLLHDVLSKTPKNTLQAIANKRGKTPNKYKIDDNIVNEHIDSFNPTVSHYRREHAPSRL